MNNAIFGSGAGTGLTTNTNGSSNTFIGYLSGNTATGGGNVYVGSGTGMINTRSNNVFIGNGAGGVAGGSQDNHVFIGAGAGAANISTTVGSNTFVGNHSGTNNTIGYSNSFYGEYSGRNNDDGHENTFLGHESGYTNVSGDYNAFLGYRSGLFATGNRNTFLGHIAGIVHVAGDYNTYVGENAGDGQTSGNHNTYLGQLAYGTSGLDYQTAIGSDAQVVTANTIILGVNTTNVGIGFSAIAFGPQRKLDILDINNPQLRLTYAQVPSANPLLGLHTDLQTTANGDLYIHPSSDATGSPVEHFVGINTSIPNNTLEIFSTSLSPQPSGLRFSNLTSASSTAPSNPGPGVLGVNVNGDVIYVPQNGNTGFGLCSPFGPPVLSGDVGLDFNEFNVLFKDPAFPPATRNNSLAIGYPACLIAPLSPKLGWLSLTTTTAAYNFTHTIAGEFLETGDYKAPPASGNDDFIGVRAECDVIDLIPPIGKRSNLGGDFYASQTTTNIGARGTAIGPSYMYNIGLNGIANNAPVNLAVYGDLFGIPPPCFVAAPPCVAPTGPANFAGYFNGDLVSTSAIYVVSDANLKQNIQDLSDPMNIINQLQPKSYTFDQQSNQSLILASNTHFGLLAQDVYNVLPQLTKECVHPARYDTLGNEIYPSINYKAVNYIELIPFLVAGMKHQQSQIDSLIEVIGNSQPPQMHQNPSGNDSGSNIDVTLSSKTVVLNQNVPNPFKEQTIIEYFIPDDATQVKIIFTDNKGDVLKEVEISEKGKGQLNVYAADLSSGVYTYTIVADGATIDTKRMLKTK